MTKRLVLALSAPLFAGLVLSIPGLLHWYELDPSHHLSAVALVRTVLFAAAALALVHGVTRGPGELPSLVGDPLLTRAGWLTTSFLVFFLLVYLTSFRVFGLLAFEDNAVETASALLLFLASLTYAAAAWKSRGKGGQFALLVLALGALVVCLEEISWGQRILGFGGIAGNEQREFNFHNLNTRLSEQVYYIGAGMLFLWAPLVARVQTVGASWKPLFPPLAMVWLSAPMVAFNYGIWHMASSQLMFFVAVFGQLAWLWTRFRRRAPANELAYPVITVAVTIIALLVFESSGEYVRSYDTKEYKEFFIALAFALHALSEGGRQK